MLFWGIEIAEHLEMKSERVRKGEGVNDWAKGSAFLHPDETRVVADRLFGARFEIDDQRGAFDCSWIVVEPKYDGLNFPYP